MTQNVALRKEVFYMSLTIGEKLKNFRINVNKTIAQAASEMNISYQALQAYESNERVPRDEVKKIIAKYYGKSVGFIFFNEQ